MLFGRVTEKVAGRRGEAQDAANARHSGGCVANVPGARANLTACPASTARIPPTRAARSSRRGKDRRGRTHSARASGGASGDLLRRHRCRRVRVALDEGRDVPSAKLGIVLGDSTRGSGRQHAQRLGRLLRRQGRGEPDQTAGGTPYVFRSPYAPICILLRATNCIP